MKSEKFKDVSIDTLPFTKCIPAHWRIVPLKYSLDILDYLREPITAGQRPQSNPIYDYYGASGVIDKIDFYNVDDKVLLIGEDGANLVLRNLPLVYKASGRFWVNNHAHILKPKFDDYDFMAYQLEAMDYYLYITGAAQPKLSQENLRKVRILQPPLVEQRAIVAYLDEKCGKVDRLVAAKEKEAALLKELKQSMIAEAVTRGISHAESAECAEGVSSPRSLRSPRENNRRLVPSGIPWLPEVPERWEVKKVRQHFRLRVEKVSEKDYPPLSVAKIGVVLQLSDVALSMAEGDTRKLVREGDYVVNSRSDRKGSCGIAPRDGSVTTISIVLEPHDIERKYVHYLFRSTPWVEEFYRNGRGIVADLWTTRYQEMRNMMFPLPPLVEQREIVAYIEVRAAKIDAAVTGLEREVAALKEYRERLIADVVTGRRKVA